MSQCQAAEKEGRLTEETGGGSNEYRSEKERSGMIDGATNKYIDDGGDDDEYAAARRLSPRLEASERGGDRRDDSLVRVLHHYLFIYEAYLFYL